MYIVKKESRNYIQLLSPNWFAVELETFNIYTPLLLKLKYYKKTSAYCSVCRGFDYKNRTQVLLFSIEHFTVAGEVFSLSDAYSLYRHIYMLVVAEL